MAFDGIEPLLDRRIDLHFAQLCQLMANIHRPENVGAYSLDDFMLFRDKAPPNPDDVEEKLHLIFGRK